MTVALGLFFLDDDSDYGDSIFPGDGERVWAPASFLLGTPSALFLRLLCVCLPPVPLNNNKY